ncbi:hypothetical protein D9611_005461 [Ephemerocybe angulata]|uniref:F-box domain-containing protein n=1 Tax=Ephemerocybe angulata TaxID=980116 RepID=A0A8H5C069_9AGAR|nr:hypothetical protein D9611_005461 [Tulosesus angulatus]
MESTSPFLKYLDTNYIPSEDEIPSIRAIIQNNDNVANALNVEIEALTAIRDLHTRESARHSALLSPIKRTPNDILSSIFIALVAHPDNRNADMSNTHPAVVISHVCEHWRELALETPALWSTIKITPPHLHRYTASADFLRRLELCLQWNLDMARIWISRSNGSRISMIFHVSDDLLEISILGGAGRDLETRNWERMAALLADLSEVVCSSSHRWVTADLYLMASRSATLPSVIRFMDIKADEVPNLRQLKIAVVVEDGLDLVPFGRDHQENILSGKALQGIHFSPSSIDFRQMHLQWGQLTQLRFDGCLGGWGGQWGPQIVFKEKEAMHLLRMCQNLVKCDLTLYTDDMDDTGAVPLDGGLVHLPRLESITIRGGAPQVEFASVLDTPRLRRLIIPGVPHMTGASTETNSVVVAWIRDYGHQLTEVEFNIARLTQSAFSFCMSNLPNVTSLRLLGFSSNSLPPNDQTFLTRDFFERLAPRTESQKVTVAPAWCPRLEVIRLPEGQGFTEADLLEFVIAKRRTNALSRLRSVRAVFPNLQEVDIPARLREMGVDTDGLTVRVSYPARVPLRKWANVVVASEDEEY